MHTFILPLILYDVWLFVIFVMTPLNLLSLTVVIKYACHVILYLYATHKNSIYLKMLANVV